MAVTAGDTREAGVSFALALLVSPPASAQFAARSNANGVAIGHVHVNAVDPWGTEIEITQGLAATGQGTR